jgi:hypothetical protein
MELEQVRWGEVAPEKVDYVLGHARRAVDHQIALMMAADQRASQMSAIMMAISLGLFGTAGTVWGAGNVRLAVAFAVSSAVMMLAAILAATSARPVRIVPSAHQPRTIVASDEYFSGPVTRMRAAEITRLQAAYDENIEAAARNAALFRYALYALIFSPFSLALAWWLQGLAI